jgi:hypothetical protein
MRGVHERGAVFVVVVCLCLCLCKPPLEAGISDHKSYYFGLTVHIVLLILFVGPVYPSRPCTLRDHSHLASSCRHLCLLLLVEIQIASGPTYMSKGIRTSFIISPTYVTGNSHSRERGIGNAQTRC